MLPDRVDDRTGARQYLLDYAVRDDMTPVVLPCGTPTELGVINYRGELVLLEPGENILEENNGTNKG